MTNHAPTLVTSYSEMTQFGELTFGEMTTVAEMTFSDLTFGEMAFGDMPFSEMTFGKPTGHLPHRSSSMFQEMSRNNAGSQIAKSMELQERVAG